MIFQQYAFIPVIIAILTSLILLLNLGWRWTILALTVQYLAVFWLVALNWSLGLASVKLVVGWVAGGLLLTSYVETTPSDEEFRLSGITGLVFKLLAAALTLILIFSLTDRLQDWFPISLPALQGATVLMGMGLLQLGMTTQPVRVVVGLLCLLSGFEILYAALETSVLVAGMLALINMGLALVGVYLVAIPGREAA